MMTDSRMIRGVQAAGLSLAAARREHSGADGHRDALSFPFKHAHPLRGAPPRSTGGPPVLPTL